MNLLEKLNTLRKKFIGGRSSNEDLMVIDGWIEEAKKLLILNSLKDHSGIKYVLEIFTGEIKKINEQLLKQRPLSEDERYRLMDKRELAQRYLDLFTPVEYDLNKLEELVDQENA